MKRSSSLESLESVVPRSMKVQRSRRINKTLKDLIWTRYIGEDVAIAPCYCCLQLGSSAVYIRSFEAGHIIARARGGSNTIGNMRPCCGRCNRGTSVKAMFTFQKDTLGFTFPLVGDLGYEEKYSHALNK